MGNDGLDVVEVKLIQSVGDLVMIIGPLQRRTTSPEPSDLVTIIAHQVMILSSQPQQDSIWQLEVMEYWKIIGISA